MRLSHMLTGLLHLYTKMYRKIMLEKFGYLPTYPYEPPIPVDIPYQNEYSKQAYQNIGFKRKGKRYNSDSVVNPIPYQKRIRS